MVPRNIYFLHQNGTPVYCLLPPPPPGYRHTRTSFFFLAGPGRLHEVTAVPALSRKSTGPRKYLSIPIRSLTPPPVKYGLQWVFLLFHAIPWPGCVGSLPPGFALSFLLLSCTPRTTCMDSSSSLAPSLPPIPFDTVSTTLPHLVPARPSTSFSHAARSTMAARPLPWARCSLGVAVSTSSRLCLSLVGYIPGCALDTVLLRGAIGNKTYGTHKNIYIFLNFYQQYLVLFSMVPGNINSHWT